MDTPEQKPEISSSAAAEKPGPSIGAVWLSLLITPTLSLCTALAQSEALGILTFLSSPITAIIAGIIMLKKIRPKRPKLFAFVIIVLIMIANASVSLAGCATLGASMFH